MAGAIVEFVMGSRDTRLSQRHCRGPRIQCEPPGQEHTGSDADRAAWSRPLYVPGVLHRQGPRDETRAMRRLASIDRDVIHGTTRELAVQFFDRTLK
jgi:hypothetical protein